MFVRIIKNRIGIILESPCGCGIEPPGSISHGVKQDFAASGSGTKWSTLTGRCPVIQVQRKVVKQEISPLVIHRKVSYFYLLSHQQNMLFTRINFNV